MKLLLLSIKRIVCFTLFGIFFSSCVSTQKFAGYVDQRLPVVQKERAQEDWLIVNMPDTEGTGNSYRQVKSYFIPAILYWEWNKTIEFELDKRVVADYIRSGIYNAADSLKLKDKLDGKQLIINFKQMPGKFLYENKGNTIILVFVQITSATEAISPFPVNLEVAYELKGNNEILKSGKGYAQNKQVADRNAWSSTENFTWMYLNDFKIEANRMGAETVRDIIRQIEEKQNPMTENQTTAVQ
jgi:hypothetical protein